jgi:hypothetical protein
MSNNGQRTYSTFNNIDDDPPPPYSPGPTPNYYDTRVRPSQSETSEGRIQRPRVPEARPTRYTPGETTPLFSEFRRPKRRSVNDSELILMFLSKLCFLVIFIAILYGFALLLMGIMRWATEPPYERRIAIIGMLPSGSSPYKITDIPGAGPAGVSTVYHLAQRADSAHIPHHITLYDKRPHIGGRSVYSVDIFSPGSGESVELGATTFPKSATILVQAADHLGLRTVAIHDGIGDLVGKGSGSFGV